MTDANRPGEPAQSLTLVDYRRRVTHLYEVVRATEDPEAAWNLWRTERDHLFRSHPQSPIPVADRPTFRGLAYYPYDRDLRFEVPVSAVAPLPPRSLGHSGSGATPAEGFGLISLPFEDAGPSTLTLYALAGYGGGVFLAFRDSTGSAETYGGGRYLLDTIKGADLGNTATGTLVVDFNFAYHPSCVHSPQWSCPLAPPENRLAIPIRGGERLP